MAGGRDVFEVEGILDQRTRRGRPEYLIRWAGFDEDEDTWEPEKNLVGCEEILEEWKRRWLAAQTPRRSKILKPIFKPPPTPPSTRKRAVKKVEEKAETKTGTPRGRPRKAAAPTPKTKVPVITVSESEEETSVVVKVAQITASNSAAHAEKKEEVAKVAENSGQKPVSTHVGKQLLNFQKVAAQEQEIAKKVTPSRKTHIVTVTESDQESDQELRRSALRSRGLTRQVFSAASTASSVTTRQESSEVATMTTRSAAVKQETHVETPVSSRLTRASLNSVRDGKVGLFSGARSRVAVRMGKVRRLLTCHNFLNLVFVVCMGAVFYTLFFLKK
ncbi:PREDICTED: chromodomain Y-like protein 2 isoform X1 [Branchiostoma belcheri]|uniref:Chromodomain Y-like protein 2 isoform X1 n=1 Tax=Branchiostoma belcheri TaxID=7741 RepID=A0A6P4ZJH7_BRABE|nr:PREDICTED: chromodomain Y-like protein 2 isoform X1 [Branchiostoma belcheri]